MFVGVTRNNKQGRIVFYNTDNKKFEKEVPLEGFQGAWALEAFADKIYIGTYKPAAILEFDINTGVLEEKADLTPVGAEYIWDFAKYKDDQLFVATSGKSGKVFNFNTDTRTVKEISVGAEQQYTRSVEYVGDYLYAGTGAVAGLLKLQYPEISDRPFQNILPAEYRKNSFVYDVKSVGDSVILGLSPSSEILLYRDGAFEIFGRTPISPNLCEREDAASIIILGNVMCYEEADDLIQSVRFSKNGTEVKLNVIAVKHDKNNFQLVTSDGFYYNASYEGEIVTEINLKDIGLNPQVSAPMSLSILNQEVFVGGAGGVRQHNLVTGETAYVAIPGEAKNICVSENTLYTANYTGAYVWKVAIPLSTEDPPQVVRVADIGNEQNRPHGMDCSKEVVIVGTEPDYGKYGGALTYINTESNDATTLRDVVLKHNILDTLIDPDNKDIVYFCTASIGGNGTTSLGEPGHIVKYGLKTNSIIFNVTPEVRSGRIHSPVILDDRLYVLSRQGFLFVLNANTGDIVKTRKDTSYTKLLADPHGIIFAFDVAGVYIVNPETLEAREIGKIPGAITDAAIDARYKFVVFTANYELWAFSY